MKKTKILYIITQGEWGGAERYVFDLATNLPPEFEVTVAVGEPEGKKDLQEKLLTGLQTSDFRLQTIKIIQLKHLVRRISPYHDILAIFELVKLFRKFNPDIVHLNSSKAGIVGSLARLFLVPCSLFLVYTVHGWVFNEPLPWWRRTLYRYLEKITTAYKDRLIVLSHADWQQAKKELSIPENKLALIRHGITPPPIKTRIETRAELLHRYFLIGADTDLQWIGTIANYYPTKGLDVLLRAIAYKKEALKRAQFFFIGEGEERTNLKKLIDSFGLEKNVFLIGSVPEAAQFLPAFDMVVLPSRKEGLPYVVLEALAARTPLIAARVGAIPEVINDGVNGMLFAPGDYNELAQKISFALEYPKIMTQYATAGAETFANFHRDLMLKQTISLYQSLRSNLK